MSLLLGNSEEESPHTADSFPTNEIAGEQYGGVDNDSSYEVVRCLSEYPLSPADQKVSKRIIRHLRSVAADIMDGRAPPMRTFSDKSEREDAILKLLLSREFNYQSRCKIAHLLPSARQAIKGAVSSEQPLKLYLDYGGGYHASTDPDFMSSVSFQPSVAELLLIHQVVHLERKLRQIHEPGLLFHIVIDDGVAHYVNDISLTDTAKYREEFRQLLANLKVDPFVKIIAQTEISNFVAQSESLRSTPATDITPEQYRNVQRFLGRTCSEAEASERMGRYAAAEKLWEPELRAMTSDGIRLLQRASEEFLSFRSFPGGATRVQCGLLGFRFKAGKLVPTLVTTTTHLNEKVVRIPISWNAILGADQADIRRVQKPISNVKLMENVL